MVYAKLRTLGRVRCCIGTKTALYLYGSLIAPMFSFNDFVYDGLNRMKNDKLQVAQNNCLRICLNCNRLTPRILTIEPTIHDDLASRGQSSTPTESWEMLTYTTLPGVFLCDMRISGVHKNSSHG